MFPPTMRIARAHLAVAGLSTLLLANCYRGGEREKEPPPGYAGGLCLAPTQTNPSPHCEDGFVCIPDPGFCYDPFDPCEGVFCGGSDRGMCQVTQDGLPSCACLPGYSTEQFELLCCPTVSGIDSVCGVIETTSAGGGDGAGTAGASSSGGTTAPVDAG